MVLLHCMKLLKAHSLQCNMYILQWQKNTRRVNVYFFKGGGPGILACLIWNQVWRVLCTGPILKKKKMEPYMILAGCWTVALAREYAWTTQLRSVFMVQFNRSIFTKAPQKMHHTSCSSAASYREPIKQWLQQNCALSRHSLPAK